MTYKNDNSTQLRMSIRMTSVEKALIERTMKNYNITGVALMLQGIENIKKKRGYRMTLDEINFMKKELLEYDDNEGDNMISDFIKFKTEHTGRLILNRSQISSVSNTGDSTQEEEPISLITMINGASYNVIGSIDGILMHYIGIKSI